MEGSTGDSSSSKLNSVNVKPVIVRVKRKAFQSPVEAFWLEINERPLKRPLLDLTKLSLSDSTEKEELKTKKVFLQHVETVSSSDAATDILQSFVDPNRADASNFRTKIDERKRAFKEENKQNQLLSRSRQNHANLSKSARFEQIWRKRKGTEESTEEGLLHEICHLYDVVRVDGEKEKFNTRKGDGDTSVEDSTILCSYLPLLSEFLPSVAEEIQNDTQSNLSEKDGYVYDLYAVQNELSPTDEDALNSYPLVQVDDDDYFYDGPIQSDYETDDSNAEDNPLNDYPDEETSEEEEEEEEDEEEEEEDEEEEEEDDDDDDKEERSRASSEEINRRSSHELNGDRHYPHFADEDMLYTEEEFDEHDDSDEGGEDDRIYKCTDFNSMQ